MNIALIKLRIKKLLRMVSVFSFVPTRKELKDTRKELKDTRKELKDTRKELKDTQAMMKNMMLHLNASKKHETIFFPECLYKIPGRQISTFELSQHVLHDGFKDLYRTLFNTENIREIRNNDDINLSDYTVFHFFRDEKISAQIWALYQSILGKPAYFIESSFITSIQAFTQESIPVQFRRFYSFLVDDLSFYFDAMEPSRISYYLNSPEARLDDTQRDRCSKLIQYIVDNQLTKYNFQPLNESEILHKSEINVLVVDQSKGDASITRGRGNADSFKRMLDAAIEENPGACIYVKTHPDTVTQGGGECYYSDTAMANVIKITEAVNPYSILKHVDKVYVCSSQLGMEALMARKKVITFGQPIYSGWGLTDDRVPIFGRNNQLTIEDLFFGLYIKFAIHIHPYIHAICSIEDFLPAMLDLRSEYFEYCKK